MPYDSKAVANYFLVLAERDGVTLSPMKIQKLVYFAHGWHLAIYDKPLIDDVVEAWEFGPVIPTLYHEFKKYGNGKITERATRLRVDENEDFPTKSVFYEIPELQNQMLETFLNVIWDKYKRFSAVQLSNLTHVPNSPWSEVYSKNVGRKNVDIPDGDIKAYFEKLT